MSTTFGEAPSTIGTTFEYRTVMAPQARSGLVVDTYASFGWIQDRKPVTSPTGVTTISLKRDRHIKNRAMVCELQNKAEVALAKIEQLEQSKTTKAMAVALGGGLLGTVALAGSVFTYMAGAIVPFIVLGVLGLFLWAVPFFAYRTVKARSTATVTPAIDRAYDTVYAACEQARALLA